MSRPRLQRHLNCSFKTEELHSLCQVPNHSLLEMKEMKCPKCGKEAEECDIIVFYLEAVEDAIRSWGSKAIFQRYIHFDCSEAKTPNFVFYVEKKVET